MRKDAYPHDLIPPVNLELRLARERVRKVAEGGHINTTYRMAVEPSLEAFRADLLRILDAQR